MDWRIPERPPACYGRRRVGGSSQVVCIVPARLDHLLHPPEEGFAVADLPVLVGQEDRERRGGVEPEETVTGRVEPVPVADRQPPGPPPEAGEQTPERCGPGPAGDVSEPNT